MLALSANEVVLHKSAVLGPIDPQINGVPAKSIKRGFENAIKKIQEDGVTSIPAYVPLLAKYDLQLLELCDDAEKLSVELATEWLTKYMLGGKNQEDVKDIVKFFSDFDNHHIHSRPITFEKIKNFGMNINYAEEALNELMWEAFLLISGFFNITRHQNISKLYENSTGYSHCI